MSIILGIFIDSFQCISYEDADKKIERFIMRTIHVQLVISKKISVKTSTH